MASSAREKQLEEALGTIRKYAALNYIGAGFEPEHMRAIANYCVGILAGEELPKDLENAPEAFFIDILRENGWEVTQHDHH